MGGATRIKPTHGMKGTPEYVAWGSMNARCKNNKNENYARYGGRGIKICDQWASFEAFYQDMDNAQAANIVLIEKIITEIIRPIIVGGLRKQNRHETQVQIGYLITVDTA
jgi:hypothetical protein